MAWCGCVLQLSFGFKWAWEGNRHTDRQTDRQTDEKDDHTQTHMERQAGANVQKEASPDKIIANKILVRIDSKS